MAIPFDYTSEYKRKLRTPEEAARVVKSGDWLDISMGPPCSRSAWIWPWPPW